MFKKQKQKMRPQIAMLLVMCMVFNLMTGMTGILVHAENESPVEDENPVVNEEENEEDEKEQATGLVVISNCPCDWDEEKQLDVFQLNEENLEKETWIDVRNTILYLGYRETVDSELTNITEGISIQKNSESEDGKVVSQPVDEEVASYKPVEGEGNEGFFEFKFIEEGDYSIIYENEDIENSVIIHVDIPDIGFYASGEAIGKDYLDNFICTRDEDTFYMILNSQDEYNVSLLEEQAFKVEDYETGDEFTDEKDIEGYISCEKIENKDNIYKIKVKAKRSFGLAVYGTVEDNEGLRDFDNYISIEYRQKMDGLLIYGDDEENEERWYEKEWETGLDGTWLSLCYKDTEESEDTPVGVNDISIAFNGTDVTNNEDVVKCGKPEDEDVDENTLEFVFYKRGDYVISYKNPANTGNNAANNEKDSITIRVDYPTIGFYKSDKKTEEDVIRDITYERKIVKEVNTFYIIPNVPEDWKSFSYKIKTEETYDENGEYITVNDKPLNPDEELKGVTKVTITDKARRDFGIKVVGTFTYSEGEPGDWEPEQFVWCTDSRFFETPIIEDGEEQRGYAGCFITEDAYKDTVFWDDTQADAQYWVHEETLQAVIDKLLECAKKGEVVVDGETYPIKNTGYIWTNTSYTKKYEEKAMVPQYLTTPSDVKGIIMTSGFETYYTVDKNETGSFFKVQEWCPKDGSGENIYTCYKEDDTDNYYPVTGSPEEGFEIDNDKPVVTGDSLSKDYEQNEEYGIVCEWPELHVDATTSVKIVGNFASKEDMAEDEAHIYLGLYEDSEDITSYIARERSEESDSFDFAKITCKDIEGDNSVITTKDGVKLKVRKLSAKAVTNAEGDFVKNIELEETGKALRDKIGIEDEIAGDEVLKQAIIDGEELEVALNMKDLKSDDATVQTEIEKIAEEAAKQMSGSNNQLSNMQYFDIGLQYSIMTKDGKRTGGITETKGGISISITLPESFASGRDLTKTKIVVYRYHDGKVEKLESEYKDGKLTFVTDKFSVYAVGVEQEKEATPVTTPETPATTPQEPVTKVPAEVGKQVTVEGNNYKVTNNAENKKTVAFSGADKKAAKVTVPATVVIDGESYQVTVIADNAFMGNSKLTTVTLPSGITKIGKNAFKNCTKLKKIDIPKNVTEVGTNAFNNCKKMTAIKFKGTKVKKIGQGAFAKCSSVKSVTIPKSVTEIGKDAFKDCKSLSKITIKGTAIKKIGKNAFKNIAKNPVVTVPKKKKADYLKLLKKAGYTKTVK